MKLALLGLVALAGLYNWRVVGKRVGDGEAALRRSAGVELAIAVLVLPVTAVLVATPTPLDAVP